MTRAITVQGAVFSAVAVFVTLLSLWLPRLDPGVELLGAACLIVLLGVPHGALDPVIAKRAYRVSGPRDWFLFTAGYLGLMLGVIVLWTYWPFVFLVGFLIITAFHFSGDPEAGTAPISRLVYGGAIVILPCLFHASEVARLFGLLAGDAAASRLVPPLHVISFGWATLLAVCALQERRRSRLVTMELLAVGAMTTVASPLAGFMVFFCGMHGARHILRTIGRQDGGASGGVLKAALPPMLIVAAVVALFLSVTPAQSLEARVVKLIFVGLASVTVPHMLLVEPLRFHEWRRSQLGNPSTMTT